MAAVVKVNKTELPLRIRAETPKDVDAISKLLAAAFAVPVTEARETVPGQECRLVEALRKLPSFDARLSLVAERVSKTDESTSSLPKSELLGHILFSPVEMPEQTCRALTLAPLAVHPSVQRQGVGSKLVQAGLDVARKLGYHTVLVLGHASYYPRFGFRQAAPLGVVCPFEGAPTEAWMLLELKKDGVTKGRPVFPRPFLGL